MIRLQKFMASAGVASRRASEKLIEEGKVMVNGQVVTQLGTTVDPEHDRVEVNQVWIKPASDKVYVLLNKPPGYVTTAKDQFGRPTVLDLLENLEGRVYPVGRLDYQTSGLLILTNDGDLTLKLTHPKHQIYKTYIATVEGEMGGAALHRLEQGVELEDFKTAPAKVKAIKVTTNESIIQIAIREGKYRQVRRMCEAVGHPVITLQRTELGKINLSGLREGAWRMMTSEEVAYLQEI